MNSLKTKLILFILVTFVVSSSILGILTARIMRKEIISSAQKTVRINTENAIETVRLRNSHELEVIRALAELDTFKRTDYSLEKKTDELKPMVSATGIKYQNIAFYDKDGFAIISTGVKHDFSQSDYVKSALAGNTFISDPRPSTVTDQLLMFYSVPVRGYDGSIVGAMVAVLNGDWLQNVADSIIIGKSSHPGIMSTRTGQMVSAVYNNDVGSAGEGQMLDENSDMAIILNDCLAGHTGEGQFLDPSLGKKMIATYGPVGDESGWVILGAAPVDDFSDVIRQVRFFTFIAVIVVSIITVILSIIIITALTKPLVSVSKAIKGIASGNADLTRKLQVTSKDEIGEVVSSFNEFVEKLRSIMIELKTSKDNLFGVGSELSESTVDTSSSITQILENIRSVHQQIQNQAGKVSETTDLINRISGNISGFDNMISDQSAGVAEASSAVEEMIGNINSVTASVDRMAESFDHLTVSSKSGIELLSDANTKIGYIRGKSKTLQDANSAIASIAEQTNLLAMNAAIEAAHAGESGKGFSVVADEIRKLSETSRAQSKNIGEQLTDIEQSILSVVEASRKSGEAFKLVEQEIEDTDQLVRQIKNAMEEQSIGSKQINEALHLMNDSTSDVRDASKEMTSLNQEVLDDVHKLLDVTTVMKQSMDEMQIGAKKINETGAQLSNLAGKMDDSLKTIGNQIDEFKV